MAESVPARRPARKPHHALPQNPARADPQAADRAPCASRLRTCDTSPPAQPGTPARWLTRCATSWPRWRAGCSAASWQLTGIHAEPRPGMSEADQRAGAATGLAAAGLFLVERRLPKISERQLALLQAALTSAAGRFSARGDGVVYVGSIFLAGSGRVLSLFRADGPELVQAVNEAALIPFASIEPAIELSGPGQP